MRRLIHAWFGYLSVAGLFGFCINLIYLALPLYVMVVYDRVLYSYTHATLYALAVGLVISFAVMALLEFLKRRMMVRVARKLAVTMTGPVIRAMHAVPEYVRGLTDLETLRGAVAGGMIFWPAELPWIVLYVVGLFLIHPYVGAAGLISVFLAACAQILLFVLERRQYTLSDVAFHANAEQIRNGLENRLLIRGMGMLPALIARYTQQDKSAGNFTDRACDLHALIGAFTELIHYLGTAAVFTAGAYVFFSEKITSGAIFAAMLMTVRLFGPLVRSLGDIKKTVEVKGAVKRLKAYIPAQGPADKFSLPEPKGELVMEAGGLTVGGKTILNNIAFSLSPGQFLGVLGPSRAGKTSLCRAILGVWPLTAGKVRLDGADLAHWPDEALGQHLGYLPQESQLFSGSVAQNIARMDEPDADKVVAAAQLAGVHEMILKLPNGYDTMINPQNGNLSAGQKQLISLARAVYGEPKFLVMDSPSTFIDEDGFRCLAECLNRLKQKNITAVIVTDKTNLLTGFDKILVIKEGQVAMYGPTQDVIAQLTGQQKA
nr:ATP-binding cassette domain-containing protein [uncultured Desulfobacter sp.]